MSRAIKAATHGAATLVFAMGGGELARRVAAVLAGLAIGGLVIAAPAQGATTVGQTSPSFGCADGIGQVQTSTAGPPTYTIPSGGVITSFTAASDGGAAVTKLLILQPLSGTVYNVVAKATGAFETSGLATFPAQIPVQAGQVIGNYGKVCRFFADSADESHQFTGSEPAVGTSQDFPTAAGGGVRIDLSANLEPDCDNDGFGDETQDQDLSPCNPVVKSDRTLTLEADKSKVKKGKKVTLSGQLDASGNEGACESGQPVELQRKKPGQTVFATVKQLQTTAAGSFSTKQKVRKTFEYRAVVVESADCLPGVSNTEKVKVKKKK